jgi:putative peptide zinc metalloprotease protein
VPTASAEPTQWGEQGVTYAEERSGETASVVPCLDPGDGAERDGGWIADHDPRPGPAAVFPENGADDAPRLAAGAELLDEYQGSGLTEATYLVRTPGGQLVQVSRLLYLVLGAIDDSRTVGQIAARVTAAFGRAVSAGNVQYLLEHKLAPLGLVQAGPGAGPADADRQAPAILALKLRLTLVPAPAVQHIARLFRPLYSPLIIVAVLGSLTGSDIWLFRGGRAGAALGYVLLHPPLLLLVFGLSMLSMLFHECGHAAACRYGGARPGVIGMGFFVIWPAFFTNVTDAYRLGRAGRIRTDLGGVYFNSVFAVMLTAGFWATGYAPLAAAVIVIHLEIVQQLLPSLRFDGYFILADLIGVPDLFRRVGPVLRSLIPGQPADARVAGLKRAARLTLTAWVVMIVVLLASELTLIILNIPGLARTFARSLDIQAHDTAVQFGRSDIAASLVSVISLVFLALPIAGLGYILLLIVRRASGAVLAVNRRHPVLRVPSAAAAALLAAALIVHWGLVPAGHLARSPNPPTTGAAVQRPAPHTGIASRAGRPARPTELASTVLRPLSAHGFDALSSPGSDPSDENDDVAAYAIDGNPATAWQTQYYLGNPVFGGLKKGTGLILDMGSQVRLSSITLTLGPVPGADVAIEIGNDNTLAAATLRTFKTVARADDIAGRYTFKAGTPAEGRYVLIWFTRLPPAGPGRFAAQIFNVTVRGWRARPAPIGPGQHNVPPAGTDFSRPYGLCSRQLQVLSRSWSR